MAFRAMKCKKFGGHCHIFFLIKKIVNHSYALQKSTLIVIVTIYWYKLLNEIV